MNKINPHQLYEKANLDFLAGKIGLFLKKSSPAGYKLLRKLKTFDMEQYYEIYEKKGIPRLKFYSWSIKAYEARILAREIKRIKPKRILIIGGYKGLSTLIVAKESLGRAKIYCIDPFFDDYIGGGNYYSVYKKITDDYNKKNQIITLKGFATIPGKEVFTHTKNSKEYFSPESWFKIDEIKEKVDLVFIDGDHQRQTVLVDFIKSYKILDEKGVILLHDIVRWFDELKWVVNYVNEVGSLEAEEYRGGEDGMLVVRKK